MGGDFGVSDLADDSDVDDSGDDSDVDGVGEDFGVDKKHTATTMQAIIAAMMIQKAGFL
jgi:hypothetical protein